MDLARLIQGGDILFDVKASSREEAYQQMLSHLVTTQALPPDLQPAVYDALLEREKIMSTAVGNGIGLPHASIPGLPKVLALIARTVTPLACQAPDHEPVQVFILVLVPKDQYATHLRTLASIARFLGPKEIRKKLVGASDPAQILSLLKES
jgi:mannitol/fructose-specific phosphotransferase system IIA component (Ntr-type)